MIQYTTLQAVAGCTTQYEKIKAIMAFVGTEFIMIITPIIIISQVIGTL